MKKFFTVLVLLLPVFVYSQDLKIVDGKIFLGNYDFVKQKNIELKGKWEFYWNKLLDPKDFADSNIKPDAFVEVPGVWTGLKIDNTILPDTGYGTFRLLIISDTTYPYDFMLYFKEVLTSYKVFFNGEEIMELGKVGKSSSEAIPKLSQKFKEVKLNKGTNYLIVQVSNYHHRTNAFDDAPKIGEHQKIKIEIFKNFASDLIIFGLLLVMAFYHLGLFVMRRKNRVALTFAIFAIIMALRTISTTNFVLSFIFPEISWELMYIIAYSTLYISVPIFVLYFKQTFNEIRFKPVFTGMYVLSSFFIFTLFLRPLIYTKIIFYYQLATFAFIIFMIHLLISYIVKRKKGARILFLSLVLLGIATVNDILHFNDLIYTTSLLPYGIFVFLLGQALTLGRIFTSAFEENETLKDELEIQKESLEELIEIRTAQLKEQNEELKATEEDLLQTLEEYRILNDKFLQKNTELYKFFTVIEQIHIGVIITDTKTRIEYVNPFFTNITGYTKDEVIGKTTNILKSGLNTKTTYEDLWNTIEAGKTWVGEFINKNKEGKYYIEKNIISPLIIDNQLINYIAIKEDVTEMRKKDKELQDKNNILEQLNIEIKAVLNDIMDSIKYAQVIQKSIFPSKEELDLILKKYFLIYIPRDVVGGDFYYVQKIANKKIIAIGDCTGHGVPGGFLTVMATSLLNEYTQFVDTLNTAQILENLRKRTIAFFSVDATASQDGFDLALVIIENGIMYYSGANIPIYVVNNQNIIEYKPTVSPIGNYPIERNFIEQRIEIQSRSFLYITTDGYVDQLSEDFNKLLKTRFKDLLLKIYELDEEKQKAYLWDYLHKWRGNIRQIDDITVLGVKLDI